MTRTNVTLILSNHDRAIAYEWLVDMIDREKINLSFILMNPGDSFIERFLSERRVPFIRIIYHGKKDLIKSVYNIYKFLKKNKTDVVHTHLFDANLAGLFAANLAGVRKRIFSRHHATFHHQYYPKAVKWDRLINSLATAIVAVSENVRKVLIQQEHVSPGKVFVIYHGFKLDEFENVAQERVEDIKVKNKYDKKSPVIGVVSRYFHLKGIQFIIPAFKKFLEQYPDACLVLANATGTYMSQVKEMLTSLPEDSYREIRFENDNAALYHSFDYFIHVPINEQIEAFGQTYVEALAASVPSVFTLSGVANMFIEDRKNAMVVPYEDADRIYIALSELATNNSLKEKIKKQGMEDVKKYFDIRKHITALENLYCSN